LPQTRSGALIPILSIRMASRAGLLNIHTLLTTFKKP
jgi:hypothetical protein